ncbi:hypothetical protein ACJ73_07131, partial [Blastomyces percursus]
ETPSTSGWASQDRQPASQPSRWVMSGTAILSFACGAFVFSSLTRLAGPLRRAFLIQALLSLASGALVEAGIVPLHARDRLTLGVLPVCALDRGID